MTQAEQAMAAINQELQSRVLTRWRGYERILLIELIRALDHIAFAFTLAPNHVELRIKDAARNYMLLGAATALCPLLKTISNTHSGVPWGPSNETLASAADEHLLNCGYLAHLRRMVELERYGLATTTFMREDYLVIEVAADTAEASERESLSWLRSWANESDVGTAEALVAQKGRIASRLDELIDISQGWFIRYDGDDKILAHHRELAAVRSKDYFEAEALPGDVLLGGRPFRDWLEASVKAQSRVLQHIACATRLMATRPGLELRNLLTVFARKDDIAAVWQESGEPSEWIRPLMNLMTLDAASSATSEADHEVPLPFYIDFGRDFVLLPSFGTLLNPCAGLVQRLKKEYRRDWDRGVDRREAIFRNDLRRIFVEPRFEIPNRGFRLRRQEGTELTDVDAVILDRQTGSLALIQLKWHDIFSRSLKERNSRRLNLLKANEWVDRVVNWVGGRSAAEVAEALKIGSASTNRTPEIFVLARYAARFSNNDVYDQRAAWVSWPELAQATSTSMEEDTLSSLSRQFRGGGGNHAQASYSRSTLFHLPGLTVELRISQ